MIITTERLIDLARQEIKSRSKRSGLTAAYLVGSVLDETPLLGGSADIDLILIHSTAPLHSREIKGLSKDVHLDIHHLPKQVYENPRELRVDPLIGGGLCGSLRLHDPDHFFDWAQAAACARFNRPDHRIARAEVLLEQARSGLAGLNQGEPLWPKRLQASAWDGLNALCCLRDGPVHGRRGLLQAQAQLEALGALDLFGNFLRLFQVDQMSQWNVPDWLTGFGKAFDLAVQMELGPEFKPVRRDYFLSAFQALAEAGKPEAAVISLIRHWPFPSSADDPFMQQVEQARLWNSLMIATGFEAANFDRKRLELETFLDEVELLIERWGISHGA